MLTPQDIQNKELTKAVFGGYDMTVVDDFLEEVQADFAALYKENSVLKSKIKVLVEKIEEYRSTEDAMRMALLTAQKMGDDLLADTKKKCADMVANAENSTREKIGNLGNDIKAEEQKLAEAKKKTAEFIALSRKVCARYNESLDTLDKVTGKMAEAPAAPKAEAPAPKENAPAAEAEAPAPAPKAVPKKKEAEIVDTAKEIDKSIAELYRDDKSADTVREFRTNDRSVDWDDDDEPTSPRPKFDFNNLQFGANYSDKD